MMTLSNIRYILYMKWVPSDLTAWIYRMCQKIESGDFT
jgi:hypothetical protein